FAVRLHGVLPAVAADAAQLVAAEGRIAVHRAAVDLHGAGAERGGDAQTARRVTGPQVSVQAVVRVVGDGDRFLFVAKRDRGDHRAEDLLARDRHVVADAGEQRRLDVVAARQMRRTFATARQRRAFLDAARDVALDALALRAGHQRTDRDAFLIGRSDLQAR